MFGAARDDEDIALAQSHQGLYILDVEQIDASFWLVRRKGRSDPCRTMPAVSYDIEFAGDLPPAVRDALAARIQTTLAGGVSGRDAHGVELTYGVIDDGASQTGDDAFQTGDDAFQIVILSDGLAVHIPYWYEGDDARRMLRRVWRVLKVAQQTLSAVPFDPQLDRALDLDRDFREVVAAYGGAVDFTAALALVPGSGAASPDRRDRPHDATGNICICRATQPGLVGGGAGVRGAGGGRADRHRRDRAGVLHHPGRGGRVGGVAHVATLTAVRRCSARPGAWGVPRFTSEVIASLDAMPDGGDMSDTRTGDAP